MITAVKSESRQTTTVPRYWLLTVQVRNLLSRTTDISQNTLEKIDKGLRNQWLQTIGVYGLDSKGRCHVGLKLTIDWETYSVQVLVWGETVSVNKTVFAEDNLAPEVGNCIRVFTQAVIEECLRTEWRVGYPKCADEARIDRELGLKTAPPLTWAGKIRKQVFSVAELPELTVTFFEAVPEPEQDDGKDKGLFDQIKDAFG
jgi:hypothetical protein